MIIGKAYYEILIAATDRMEISDNIMAIVTDSADTNGTMCELFEQRARKSWNRGKINPATRPPSVFRTSSCWIRCFCHAVNRSTQKILVQLKVQSPKEKEELYDDMRFTSTTNHSSAFGKMRRIIAKTKRSDPLKAALSRMCGALLITYHKLCLDMEIRWNSTYVMLKIFLSMEPAFKALFPTSEAKECGIDHLFLSEDEWAYLHRLESVFQIFQPLITKLSVQSYPHAYNVLPSYIMLQGKLKTFIRDYADDDPTLVTAMEEGSQVLKKYLDFAKEQTSAVICVLLNPKMKMKKLIEIGWTKAERARDRKAFVEVFEEYVDRFGRPETVAISEDINGEDSEDELAWDCEVDLDVSPEPEPSNFSTEVERWFAVPCQQKNDPLTYLQYWKGMATTFPILSRMARDYGCILASSVASESVFSIAGLQMTNNRNRLAPKTMGIIMCLRSWGCLPEEFNNEDQLEGREVREDVRNGWVEEESNPSQQRENEVAEGGDIEEEYPDIDDIVAD
jgi:hypothetical protein